MKFFKPFTFWKQASIANGGIKFLSGPYTVHVFTSSANFNVTSQLPFNVEVLMVAGGGSGGHGYAGAGGGGGGAGGLVWTAAYMQTGTYPVVVGTGGVTPNTDGASGVNGINSTFNGFIAYGGGGGGDAATYNSTAGLAGGSGGGASAGYTAQSGGAANADLNNTGYSGGSAMAGWTGGSYGAGGGGGAASAGLIGQSTAAGGKGGDGLQLAIDGTTRYYSGGGGAVFGAGPGLGGGASNYGGGGGAGGAGGPGIVIIRYKTATNFNPIGALGGRKIVVNDYVIHTFKASDTLYLASGGSAEYLAVGGGGSGGMTMGGGGGGGGVVNTTDNFTRGLYPVTIGDGGTYIDHSYYGGGGPYTASYWTYVYESGINGNNTVFYGPQMLQDAELDTGIGWKLNGITPAGNIYTSNTVYPGTGNGYAGFGYGSETWFAQAMTGLSVGSTYTCSISVSNRSDGSLTARLDNGDVSGSNPPGAFYSQSISGNQVWTFTFVPTQSTMTFSIYIPYHSITLAQVSVNYVRINKIITALGGGGGGGGISETAEGKSGGCGGGGPGKSNTLTIAAGLQGGNGGKGTSWTYGAGGGGGAGGSGQDGSPNTGGNGGIGYLSSITGTPTYYAGGGGGGSWSGYPFGAGGLGGGGQGSGYGLGQGVDGTPNTGGGGGAMGPMNRVPGTNYLGAFGGSGIVIFRYPI